VIARFNCKYQRLFTLSLQVTLEDKSTMGGVFGPTAGAGEGVRMALGACKRPRFKLTCAYGVLAPFGLFRLDI
jgi:hypothetical protein